ncbi:ATP-dependent DNA helicase RecG [Patescibacteria group bacterium]|nr:ATP-dependent DNA helicase RecG [Patescibacteria group bacterium]
MTLDQPITNLGVFVRRYTRDLATLGIKTAEDALLHFPFRYEDLSQVTDIQQMREGEQCTVRGFVKSIGSFRTPRRNMVIVEAILSDKTGSAVLTWFGQQHIAKTVQIGDELMISGIVTRGKNGLQFVSPAWEPVREVQAHVGRIAPVYSVSGALTPKALRTIMLRLLPVSGSILEIVPDSIRKNEGLLPRGDMIRALHFPESMEEVRVASRTRDFEQLFLLSLGNAWMRADLERFKAIPIPFAEVETKQFVSNLPFTLTKGQRVSSWEILQDLMRDVPMNRLLDGDVGAGKTVVAALAALNVALAGAQTVFLVPTGVLAGQHFQSLTRLFATEDVSIALLTAGTLRTAHHGVISETDRGTVVREIASGTHQIVVGTHALLEDDVVFSRLALAVVDEQHRFGVAQRKKLARKAEDGLLPHLLSMTATPIPRTLTLTAFGDLSLSRIPERPPGRTPVETILVTKERDTTIAAAIRAARANGHQVFVVCPRITDEGASDRRAVSIVALEIAMLVPECRVATLHGKLKTQEKEQIMAAFVAGEQDILVSTTVIEVGVDVPNATLMIIDGADAFGLSQLHQLRGRVGRGGAAGTCLLLPQHASRETFLRLKLLTECHDGWRLAEADLETRGPGEMLGTSQSGFGELTLETLRNEAVREAAARAAEELLKKDPSLEREPYLRRCLEKRFADVQLS